MTLSQSTLLILALVAALADTALAQSGRTTPGAIVEGSPNVQSGGLPAARVGDATTPRGKVARGSRNVFINGKRAARVGDRTNCGVIVSGSSNVFINGRPMARTGDTTSGC